MVKKAIKKVTVDQLIEKYAEKRNDILVDFCNYDDAMMVCIRTADENLKDELQELVDDLERKVDDLNDELSEKADELDEIESGCMTIEVRSLALRQKIEDFVKSEIYPLYSDQQKYLNF